LDEPFVALDAIVRGEIQDRLLDALSRSPATVLMVSHSVEDAVMLADVVHVLQTRPMRVAASFRLPQPGRDAVVTFRSPGRGQKCTMRSARHDEMAIDLTRRLEDLDRATNAFLRKPP